MRWINVSSLGAVVLVGAMAVGLARVMTIQEALYDPDRIVLRIAHWQLEAGYREALQDAIDAYEARHENVTIKQIAIGGGVYGQWLQTRLISDDGPDLAEIGSGRLGSDTHYLPRYFLPLGGLADRPNPYHVDTDLEHVPWRETFVDGMRGGYRHEVQEYFSVPTVIWTIRVYYNKDLLRQATGSDEPPASLGQLFAMCDQIRTFARQSGRGDDLVPIAGNRTHGGRFISQYMVPFTAALEKRLDLDLDGAVGATHYDSDLTGGRGGGSWETYIGILSGAVGFDDPHIRGYFACGRRIAEQFNEGFMSLAREDGMFMFAQQRAVMICSGSWNTHGLMEQDDFEVGVFDCPLPGPGERWHELVAGRPDEATRAGAVCFGVYKHSPHVERAVDFLHFFTSRKINERFNREANWVPVVVGAEPSPRMKHFLPDPRGFVTGITLSYGAHAGQVIHGEMWRFFSGEITYEAMAARAEEAIHHPRLGGDKAWARQYDQLRRWCRDQQRVLAAHNLVDLLGGGEEDVKVKYRRALLQQVRFNNGNEMRHRFETMRERGIDALVD